MSPRGRSPRRGRQSRQRTRRLLLIGLTLLVGVALAGPVGTASADGPTLDNPSCEETSNGKQPAAWNGSTDVICYTTDFIGPAAPDGNKTFLSRSANTSVYQNVSVAPDSSYRVAGSFATDLSDSSPDQAKVIVEFYDNGTHLGNSTVLGPSQSDGAWSRFSNKVETPSGADTMSVRLFFIQYASDRNHVSFDNISVDQATGAPSVDTNTGLTVSEGANGTTISTSNLSASDPDGDSLTYDVIDPVGNGTLFVDGSGDGTDDGTLDGESPIQSGTFTQSDIENGQLLYTHDGSEADSESFDFEVSDGSGGVPAQGTFAITVEDVNDAPVLSTDNRSLSDIGEDDTASAGNTAASILGSAGTASDTDGDPLGVALTGAETQNGVWQYSLDGGSTWTAVSTLSDENALLLGPSDRLRFVPDDDFDGSAAATVRAWDGTSGTNGTTADTSTNGGETAYSTATTRAVVQVLDAPEVTNITRASPSSPTNDDSVTFDVTFDRSIPTVSTGEFAVSIGNGSVSGEISSIRHSQGSTVSITVGNVAGDGTLRLDLVDSDAFTSDGVPLGGVGTTGPANGSYTDGETFTIDNTAPAAPAGLALASTHTGESSTVTSDSTPTISGTAEAGATVTVASDLDGVVGQTTANESGGWKLTPSTALSTGTHRLNATATDPAGNEGPASSPFEVTIDTTGPDPPARPALTAASDTGESDTDNVTRDATPTVTGTAEAGVTVAVSSDRAGRLGTATATDGTYSFTPETTLSEGTHNITVTAIDAAGNTASGTGPLVVTVDTTAPAAPTGVALDAASDTDGLTNDSTPAITGTAETGVVVELRSDRAGVLGTTAVGDDGNWLLTPEANLSEGTHTIIATAVDRAGNDSPASGAVTVTVDTMAPGFASNSTPSIREGQTGQVVDVEAGDDGPSSPDTNVTYELAGADAAPFSIDPDTGVLALDGALDYEAPSDTDGDSAYELTVTATDGVGNERTQTLTVTVAQANERPMVVNNTALTVDEGATEVTINSTRLGVTDPEQSADSLTYNVTAPVSHGTLFVDGSGDGTDDGRRDGEPALGTGTFSQTAIDDGNLLYSHDDSDSLRDAFSFAVTDGAGANVSAKTFDIVVTPVSDDSGDSSSGDSSSGGSGGTSVSFVHGEQTDDGAVQFTVPDGSTDAVVLRAIDSNGLLEAERRSPVAVERLAVRPTDEFETEHTVPVQSWATETTERGSDRSRDLLVSTGASALGHVTVSESIPDDAIDNATVWLRVQKRYLDQHAARPDTAAIYADGATGWRRLDTTVARETDSYYVFEAVSPGLRSLALGINSSAVELDETTLAAGQTTVSEPVTVSVSVRNLGLSPGTETVELRANGSVVGTRTVDVPANDSERVTLSFSPNETGDYRLSVGETAVGTVTVASAASTDSGPAAPPSDTRTTPTPTAVADTDTQTADDTRTTGGSGPGFTLLGAIVALGTGVALARRLD